MDQRIDRAGAMTPAVTGATVRIVPRRELAGLPQWQSAFARQRKDHRYYELVEDTLTDGFAYGYLGIESGGAIIAIQPFFTIDQDLMAGAGRAAAAFVAAARRIWPRFLRAHTLMVGCAAGEGHLDGDNAAATGEVLARALTKLARERGCSMAVLKEFPAQYRAPLQALRAAGFARIPSMPMTTLALDYANFDDYLARALSANSRSTVRRKLRVAARAEPAITMDVVVDATPIVGELYPLYEKVYQRSPLKFEKLTREFLGEIGRRMPDKVRFLVWRQGERIIAFALCMVHEGSIGFDYVGFDYAVAFKLHLYYRVFRDLIDWATANGCTRFYSGSLNYDPKWHLRQSLYPIDLYVRHTSDLINAVFRRLLPLMEPTRADPILPNFSNYRELWE
jgi:Acetyltransferase (GNAT) domain